MIRVLLIIIHHSHQNTLPNIPLFFKTEICEYYLDVFAKDFGDYQLFWNLCRIYLLTLIPDSIAPSM